MVYFVSQISEQTFTNEQESVNRREWYSKKKGDPGASGDRGYAKIWGISLSQKMESPRLLSKLPPCPKGGLESEEIRGV